jgi:hypothetical protein
MRVIRVLSAVVVCTSVLSPAAVPVRLSAQAPTVNIPKPGVPQIMTLEGTWVRAAYNNEGYAIIGYRLANLSVGEEWMMIEFGTTVRGGVPAYTMTRETLSLDTPDGKTIPLATNIDVRNANLRSLQMREKVQRDSINYFPPEASDACRIGFFAELDSRAMAYDQVELSSRRGCVGRLYFKVPGGIAYGQHWLNVKFEKSVVRVPFRIFTEEEEKTVSKNFGDIQKQVENAFKKKKS